MRGNAYPSRRAESAAEPLAPAAGDDAASRDARVLLFASRGENVAAGDPAIQMCVAALRDDPSCLAPGLAGL